MIKSWFAADIRRKISCVEGKLRIDDDRKVINQLEKIKDHRSDSDVSQWVIANFIQEIWLGESPEEIKYINFIDEIFKDKIDINTKVANKVMNILSAFRYLDGKIMDLDTALVKSLQCIVGKDIIEEAGIFRTVCVKATGCDLVYLAPNHIEEMLGTLLKVIRDHMTTSENDTYKIFAGAAVFFSEFLLIHPFKNGNGRTARLLLNFILQKHVNIHFTLGGCSGNENDIKKNRKMYLDVLNARNDKITPPYYLALYMINSLKTLCSTVQYLME